MRYNRRLTITLIIILSLIFLCIFISEISRSNVFKFEEFDYSYEYNIELKAKNGNPDIRLADLDEFCNFYSLGSVIKTDERNYYIEYNNYPVDIDNVWLRYNSYSEDDYCFLYYNPFDPQDCKELEDQITIFDHELQISGLCSHLGYDGYQTLCVDYKKWLDLECSVYLSSVDFFTDKKLTDDELGVVRNVFRDYEITGFKEEDIYITDMMGDSLSVLIYELIMPSLILIVSLALIISYFDCSNSRKSIYHVIGYSIKRIMIKELFSFFVISVLGGVIAVLFLFFLSRLEFFRIIYDQIKVKEPLAFTVIVYSILTMLFALIASLRSVKKWRYAT